MNKINRFLIIYMIVITALCAYMCYLAFSRKEVTDSTNQIHTESVKQATTKQTTTKEKKKVTYSLKILDGNLAVINNKTKEIFEYTDMKKENLPSDILTMLRENFVFENREEVYHFLESYSS